MHPVARRTRYGCGRVSCKPDPVGQSQAQDYQASRLRTVSRRQPQSKRNSPSIPPDEMLRCARGPGTPGSAVMQPLCQDIHNHNIVPQLRETAEGHDRQMLDIEEMYRAVPPGFYIRFHMRFSCSPPDEGLIFNPLHPIPRFRTFPPIPLPTQPIRLIYSTAAAAVSPYKPYPTRTLVLRPAERDGVVQSAPSSLEVRGLT